MRGFGRHMKNKKKKTKFINTQRRTFNGYNDVRARGKKENHDGGGRCRGGREIVV